jgi:hypothetical protein
LPERSCFGKARPTRQNRADAGKSGDIRGRVSVRNRDTRRPMR